MCRKHGGKVPDKQLSPQRLAARQAHRILRRAYDEGMISTKLQGQPVWIACGHWRRVHLRPILLAAWLSQEGEAWPRIVSQVEDALESLPMSRDTGHA